MSVAAVAIDPPRSSLAGALQYESGRWIAPTNGMSLAPDLRLRLNFHLAAESKSARHALPETCLMLAVLEDALSIYRKYAGLRGRKHRRLLLETEQWLFSDDTNWPFSFINVCDAVGIDVAWLRSRATAPATANAPEQIGRS